MIWEQVERHWDDFKGAIREQWSRLSEADLDEIAGRRERLLQKLQAHYGSGRAQVEAEVRAFWDRLETLQPSRP